jgi:hypothetical protein
VTVPVVVVVVVVVARSVSLQRCLGALGAFLNYSSTTFITATGSLLQIQLLELILSTEKRGEKRTRIFHRGCIERFLGFCVGLF